MNTTVIFNTVEDMAAWVVANPGYRATMRWSLEDRTSQEHDDAEAGKAWDKEYYEMPYVSYHDEPAHTHYELVKRELSDRQPSKHRVTTWTLEQATSDRYSRGATIYLSTELAEQINATWKVGPAYRGSRDTKRVGIMTIAGIVKRLGVKGFDKQIKDATVAAQTLADKNARNNNRDYAVKQAEELHNLMTKNTRNVFSASDIAMISLVISNIKNSKEA